MRSFNSWTLIGLLGLEIIVAMAAPDPGAKFNPGEREEDVHSPEFWSGNPKTHAYIWESERTSYSPSTEVWYTGTTVAHKTTKYLSSPCNRTIIASEVSTISWKLTSTTTFSTTSTLVSSSIATSPPPNPCPTSCKISAGTVNLFYWPTNQPHEYPTTHFDSHLDYVFTSPSVYMIVDKIYGTNTAGDIAGPSGTSVIFPLNLDEVSTIVPNISATHQLTLNDLRTDCPQTEPASVIATKVPGGPCDPILAAPKKVRSWASPCGACQNFGLFDPPYAVSPLTGGLVPMTATTKAPAPEKTTPTGSSAENASGETPPAITAPYSSTGVAVTLTESSGLLVATIPAISSTSSAQPLAESTDINSGSYATSDTFAQVSPDMPSVQTPTSSPKSISTSSTSGVVNQSSTTPVIPSVATKLSDGLKWVTVLIIGFCLL